MSPSATSVVLVLVEFILVTELKHRHKQIIMFPISDPPPELVPSQKGKTKVKVHK